jgi:hypothetical protein
MRHLFNMKKLFKILKNFSLNIFWILMFITLWPIDNNYPILRLSASFLAALLLAVFTVLFEEN